MTEAAICIEVNHSSKIAQGDDGDAGRRALAHFGKVLMMDRRHRAQVAMSQVERVKDFVLCLAAQGEVEVAEQALRLVTISLLSPTCPFHA